MVYILLGTGFEETEAIAPCDLLRRAGVETCFAGIGAQTVTGSHGIAVKADVTLDEIDFDAMQMVVLPGGHRPRSLAVGPPAPGASASSPRIRPPVSARWHHPPGHWLARQPFCPLHCSRTP